MTRRTWNVAWLVVALIIGGLVAARYARVFGLLGILASVLIAVVVVLAILRAIGPTWFIPSRPPVPPPDPRNVTPPEPPISTRSTSSSSSGWGSTIGPRPASPPVVVIEPGGSAAETLEAKLLTLDRLRGEGRLTDAEYEAKRAQLIADF
jgi:hypothetical protein